MKRKIIIINITKTKVSALARLNNGKSIKIITVESDVDKTTVKYCWGVLKLQNDSAFKLILNVKFSFLFKEIKSICYN